MNRMRTLLLHLPLTPPGPHASYGQAWVDTAALRDGREAEPPRA